MECEAVLVLLWQYLDEELGGEEADTIRSHISHCPTCHPAYCCDRAFLELLARQRHQCLAPPSLVMSVLSRLRPT